MSHFASRFETTAAPARRSQLVSIQYLRAVAALTVLVTHALQWPLGHENNALIATGRLGVEIFFVLSGFIITVVGGEGRFDPAYFARHRILRIVPVYWLATLLVVGLAVAMPSSFRTTVPTLEGLIKSFLFVPSESPKAPLLMLGWTLNFEAFFYLCFGSLFFVGARLRAALVAALFVVLMVIGRMLQQPSYLQEIYTSLSLLGFVFGMGAGRLYQSGALRFGRRAAIALIAAGLVSLTAFYWTALALDQDRYLPLFHLTMSFAALVILLSAIRFEMSGRLADIALLRLCGDASYSLYLFHLFVVAATWSVAAKWFGPFGWTSYLLVTAVAIAGGLIAGLVAYRLLEKPLLGWMRQRRSIKAAQAVAS